MNKISLIEWVAARLPEEQRESFKQSLGAELDNWLGPPPETDRILCKNCPRPKHVHYESKGKLVTPGCSGFEPAEATPGANGVGRSR